MNKTTEQLTEQQILALGFEDGTLDKSFHKLIDLNELPRNPFMMLLRPIEDRPGAYNVVFNPSLTDNHNMVTITQVCSENQLKQTIQVLTHFQRETVG